MPLQNHSWPSSSCPECSASSRPAGAGGCPRTPRRIPRPCRLGLVEVSRTSLGLAASGGACLRVVSASPLSQCLVSMPSLQQWDNKTPMRRERAARARHQRQGWTRQWGAGLVEQVSFSPAKGEGHPSARRRCGGVRHPWDGQAVAGIEMRPERRGHRRRLTT